LQHEQGVEKQGLAKKSQALLLLRWKKSTVILR